MVILKKVDIGLRKLSVRADEIGKILTGELSDYKELTHSKDNIRIIYRIDEYQVEIVAIIATFNLVDDEVFQIAEAMESFKRKAK
jgi:mRNA interferase RelE/StbE